MRTKENKLKVSVLLEETEKGYTLRWETSPSKTLELAGVDGNKYQSNNGLIFDSLHEAKMFFIRSLNHSYVH